MKSSRLKRGCSLLVIVGILSGNILAEEITSPIAINEAFFKSYSRWD